MSGPKIHMGDDSVPPRTRYDLLPLLVALLSTVGVIAWLLPHRGGTASVGYLGGPVSMLAATVACRRLTHLRGLSRPVVVFWRRHFQAGILVGVGAGTSLLIDHDAVGLPAWVSLPIVGGVAAALLGYAQLPFGERSALRWGQLALDGATVAVAGALVFWYMIVDLAPPGTTAIAMTGAAVVGVGGLLCVAVIGKVAMTPGSPVDGSALRLLTIAPLAAVAASALLIVGEQGSRLAVSVLGVPLAGVSICAAATQQLRSLQHPAENPPTAVRRSFYNLLPLLAVVATTALLISVATRQMNTEQRNVVAGAALIAALIGVRQVLGLRDKNRMLRSIRRQQAQLEHQAHHDPLTSLANRTRFGAVLGDRLRVGRGAGVLIVDIDDFKMVNDTMGHVVGDRLLVAFAQRLQAFVGADELPARLGGDEFAVLLDSGEAAHAEETAELLLTALTVPFRVGEHQLLVHASIGIALGAAGDAADDVLRNADTAMYAAKSAGKAAWTRFEPRMHLEAVNHARVASELHDAIRRHELFLAYQPVFDITTLALSGVEALVRWRHPVRGTIPPAEFIPVAERTGLVVPLGLWVLREACEQLARWHAAYGTGALAAVNVNVAARQLRDTRFVDEVAAVLSDTGLCPRQLVLEVTESSVLDGPQVRESLQSLHDLGVRLALDDFGTGSSSLSLLRGFPVDVLKLDKSFVDGICDGEDRGRLAVAAAVAQLAETLELSAVAEGIETEEQMQRLRRLGYRLGQGFHLARPLPADGVAAIMAHAGAADQRPTANRPGVGSVRPS